MGWEINNRKGEGEEEEASIKLRRYCAEWNKIENWKWEKGGIIGCSSTQQV